MWWQRWIFDAPIIQEECQPELIKAYLDAEDIMGGL